MKRAVGLGLAVLALSACPSTGVVCRTGTERCGNGCVDTQSDFRNCGACGAPCLGSQICSSGSCLCRQGTALCSGQCVALENDPKNCGACGKACGTTVSGAPEVCVNGECGEHCPAGNTRCGGACTQLENDALNCSRCGNVCPDSQSCRRGACTWDLVAACFSTGQVAGLQSGSDRRGPLAPLGSGPISLASYGGLLLVADAIDNRLLQARVPSFEQLSDVNATGAGVNHVLVAAPFVYAVNSIAHTVQVLTAGDAGCPPVMQPDAGCAVVGLSDGGLVQPLMGDGGCFFPAATDGGCAPTLLSDGGLGPFVPEEDAGCFTVPRPMLPPPCVLDGGLKLVTVGAVDTGMSTYPQAAAKAGSALWVPLWGDIGAGSAAGQKVLKIDVSNPASPSIVGTVDLTLLALLQFDGGSTAVPRPYAIVEHAGKLWVPLNNTTAGLPLIPQGPGLLAEIDPGTLVAVGHDLGPGCLNPVAVVAADSKLFVSCGGAASYDMNFNLVSNSGYGVVAFAPDAGVVARWTPECPAPACAPILPSRLAVRDGRIYLGDQSAGRIFVADVRADGSITVRRGYGSTAQGGPVQACGLAPGGYSNVADIISLP